MEKLKSTNIFLSEDELREITSTQKQPEEESVGCNTKTEVIPSFTNKLKMAKTSSITKLKSSSIYKDMFDLLRILLKHSGNLPKKYQNLWDRVIQLIIEDFQQEFKQAFLLDNTQSDKKQKIQELSITLNVISTYIKIVLEDPSIRFGKDEEDQTLIFEILGKLGLAIEKWYSSMKRPS